MRSNVLAASKASLFRTITDRLSIETVSLWEIVFRISFLTLVIPSLLALLVKVAKLSFNSLPIAFHVFPDRYKALAWFHWFSVTQGTLPYKVALGNGLSCLLFHMEQLVKLMTHYIWCTLNNHTTTSCTPLYR